MGDEVAIGWQTDPLHSPGERKGCGNALDRDCCFLDWPVAGTRTFRLETITVIFSEPRRSGHTSTYVAGGGGAWGYCTYLSVFSQSFIPWQAREMP